MQILRKAEAEAVGHVEVRRSFFGVRIEGVLREAGRNCAGGTGATEHLACGVDGLAPGVACLNAGPVGSQCARERCLEGVVGRMCVGKDHVFDAKAAGYVAGTVEGCMGRETRVCTRICIGKSITRETLGGSADIAGVSRQVAEFALEASR